MDRQATLAHGRTIQIHASWRREPAYNSVRFFIALVLTSPHSGGSVPAGHSWRNHTPAGDAPCVAAAAA